MKYIEHIKSVVLFLLVSLSLFLTFMIWNYQPNYKTAEDATAKQVSIGSKKAIEQVIKPYRILFKDGDTFTGSVSGTVIDSLMAMIPTMQAQNLTLINNNLSNDKINEMLRLPERMTLFFPTEVPLPFFSSILPFSEDLPETTFNRIIIDWSRLTTTRQLQFLFINTENRTLYRSYVKVHEEAKLLKGFIEPALNFARYEEVERQDKLSLYTISEPIESVKYNYYFNEISLDLFKHVLFPDPNIVQRNTEESTQAEKYTDGMSLMTVDRQSKMINYVYPAAESISDIPASRLLRDSFDFLNEHGGITADFRYSSMNNLKHVVEYQLFFQGLPVYSDDTLTRITTIWGDNRIFRYRRPYYSIEVGEYSVKELLSGPEILDYIKHHTDYKLEQIKDIVVGYYLTQNQNNKSFTLEPSWFVITKDGWTHVMPERVGGVEYGLE